MKSNEVQTVVKDLVTLIQALPNSSTLETLDRKAQESAGVYETSYTRDSVDHKTTEYLDVFFLEHESHLSVIANAKAYTLEIVPDHTQDYEGDKLITIPRDR